MPARNVLALPLPNVVADIEYKPSSRVEDPASLGPGLLMELSILRTPMEITAVVAGQAPSEIVGITSTHAAVLGVVAIGKTVAVRRRCDDGIKLGCTEGNCERITQQCAFVKISPFTLDLDSDGFDLPIDVQGKLVDASDTRKGIENLDVCRFKQLAEDGKNRRAEHGGMCDPGWIQLL
ncbi:MAG: hypothetical protein V3S26_08215 [Acidimicrobiia bacterium]